MAQPSWSDLSKPLLAFLRFKSRKGASWPDLRVWGAENRCDHSTMVQCLAYLDGEGLAFATGADDAVRWFAGTKRGTRRPKRATLIDAWAE